MPENILTGAELASMLKGSLRSSMNFNGLLGVDDESLHLSEDQIKWWRDAKFGLFIHWGVYSVIGKGEWAYFNEQIPEDAYRRVAEEEFRPNRSAAEITDEWLDTAQSADMKYAVMVTRHHDGFAMWDSRCSWKNFTSAACGPKTDYVKPFTDGCHRRGLYTGLYYSPMDWRFPGYFDPKGQPESAALMKEQGYGQLRELCSDFGRVDILWYDGGWLAHTGSDADSAWFWEPLKMNHMIRRLQPGIMTTPRSGYKGDFETDEGSHMVKGGIVPIPWEKCMTISSVWGYRPDDKLWDSDYIIRMLVNTVCRDGNLLLNVSPDPEGFIPDAQKNTLRQVGDWLNENGESIYGTRGGIWQPVDDVFGCTYTDKAVYLHILDCSAFENILLPADRQFSHAITLDGREIELIYSENGLKADIPKDITAENRTDTVIKLLI